MAHSKTTTPTYFKSMGGGQFFKVEGKKVLIACVYDFNPSIERTTYDDNLIIALGCQSCDEAEFNRAIAMVLKDLQILEAV